MNELFDSENYLLISGIQHFVFCKHQWGLIHIESFWEDNSLTEEGRELHERADNSELKESRKNFFVSRGVEVISHKLQIRGRIDVIEFIKGEKGVAISGKNGLYVPTIIEYKRGKPKLGFEDKAQLCALSMAYEEMKNYELDFGYLFYFQTNHREKVFFDLELRNFVKKAISEMQNFYITKTTPKPEKSKKCNNCSVNETCSKNFIDKNTSRYLDSFYKD